MGISKNGIKKALLDSTRVMLYVHTDDFSVEEQLDTALTEFLKTKNDVLKCKICVLLKAKADADAKSTIQKEINWVKEKYFDLGVSADEVTKRAKLNEKFIQLYNSNRTLFGVYRTLWLEFGYKGTTLYQNILWFEKNKVFDGLDVGVLIDLLDKIKSTGENENKVLDRMLSFSSATKVCESCGEELPIFEFKTSTNKCRKCNRIHDLRRSGGEEAVKKYLTRQCTKTTEDSIKTFKEESAETEEKATVTYSKAYLGIKCQVDSLNSFIDGMYYTDTSGLTEDEKVNINIMLIDIAKKLLETERKIYAEQSKSL